MIVDQQTKLASFIEAAVNTVLGYITAMITQVIFYPLFNIHVTIHDQLLLALLFTVVSLVRNYFVRRVFNNYYQAMLQWLNNSVSKCFNTLLHIPNNLVNIPCNLFSKPKSITKIIEKNTSFYDFVSGNGLRTEYDTMTAILDYYEQIYPESEMIQVNPVVIERSRKCFEVKIEF